MERRVGSYLRELLDRMLTVNARHLRQVPTEYEAHFNAHRPHRSLAQAAPLYDHRTGPERAISRSSVSV
ncbi:MAG TPA: integrase core domain-containing protein [Pseudonocardiaceae bacterium]|nr:integrase core domain-containing protein [Pseudonocardiaceae bacterium]